MNLFAFLTISFKLYLNIKNASNGLDYHLLHIDERQIIDSVLNVFQISDEFERFNFIQDGLIKKLVIIFGELFFGGNLDFGRLWINIFIFVSGPFYFFNPNMMIFVSRLIQISFFYIFIIYLLLNFIDKNKRGLFLLIVLGIPGLIYIIENPKPDTLLLIFFFIGIKKIFQDNEINRGFFFIGISIGLKIISLVPALLLGLYLIYPIKQINSLDKFFKVNLFTLLGIVVGQPALLIPHPSIYKRIFSAISQASSYNQTNFFILDTSNALNWIDTLSSWFSVNQFFIFLLYFLVIIEIFFNVFKNINIQQNYYLISFLLTSLFLFFNVERTWIYYLAIPFFIFILYFFSINKFFVVTKVTIVILVLLLINGMVVNYEKLSSNYLYVDTQKEENMYAAIDFINSEYLEKNFYYNTVLWDPDYYFPRNGVTFNGYFKVLENWEITEKYQPLYKNSDFIVTTKIFDFEENVVAKNIGDLYIYYLSK